MYVYEPYIFALCRIEPRGVLYVRQKQWGVTHKGDTLEDGQEVISRIFFSYNFPLKIAPRMLFRCWVAGRTMC